MLYKEIPINTDSVESFVVLDDMLTKEASVQDALSFYYHPEIITFAKQYTPAPGRYALVVGAQGAAEFWGCNNRNDLFREEQILGPTKDWGYLSFYNAKVFTHHNNKDPNKSLGNVAVSVYNPEMHRTELVLVIEESKAPNVANGNFFMDRLSKKLNVNVSMGCNVPYDICTICGNRSQTSADRCDHIANHSGEVYPDGKRACMDNYHPKYFDISLVGKPADSLGKSLLKVASDVDDYVYYKQADALKTAMLTKRVPGETLNTIDDLKARIPTINSAILDSFDPIPLEVIIGLLIKHKIILKPEEFQYIVLRKFNKEAAAKLLASGKVFNKTNKATKIAMEFDPTIRIYSDALIKRAAENFDMVLRETAAVPPIYRVEKVANSELNTISNLYNGYKDALIDELTYTLQKNASFIDLEYMQTTSPLIDIIGGF